MGTRGFVGFQCDGKIRGLYNHNDSYPEGLGREVVNHLREFIIPLGPKFKTKLIPNFKKIQWISEENLEDEVVIMTFANTTLLIGCLQDKALGLTSNSSQIRNYFEKPSPFVDSSDFLENSLFCKWAYIINLDKKTLDVKTKGAMGTWPLFKLPKSIITQMNALGEY